MEVGSIEVSTGPVTACNVGQVVFKTLKTVVPTITAVVDVSEGVNTLPVATEHLWSTDCSAIPAVFAVVKDVHTPPVTALLAVRAHHPAASAVARVCIYDHTNSAAALS